MKPWTGLLNKNLLGVDLGSRTIKGLRLKKTRGRVSLDGYFFHDLAQTSPSYPERADTDETLKAGVELQKLQNLRFAASIPDSEVLHVVLSLPDLDPKELRTAVGHELSEHTGIPLEELIYDFKVKDSTSVSAYGTRRKVVDDLVGRLGQAKLRPAVVEPDTLATLAMLEFNDYIDAESAYAVFDLGERHLTATLIDGGEIRLSKSMPGGMGRINTALMERLGFSYNEAEIRKRKYDFNSCDREEQKVELVIDEVYAAIFSDAKGAIELFRGQLGDKRQLKQALLVGGGSQTPNIEKVFEMFFKVPTIVVNPFRNIEIFTPKNESAADEIGAIAPFMAAAVGSALGELASKKVKVAA